MSEHSKRWALGVMVGLTLAACALDSAPQAGAPCPNDALRCEGSDDPTDLDAAPEDAPTADTQEDVAPQDVAQAEDAAPDAVQAEDAADDATPSEDVPLDACVEQTCEALQVSCGVVDNGCGVMMRCGACSNAEGCGVDSEMRQSCLPCPQGSYNNGADQCAPPGSCAPGFHDDGRGACVDGDTCAMGLRFEAGRCVGSYAVTDMPAGRLGHEATTLPEGRILVTGGSAQMGIVGIGEGQRNAWLYDPGSDTWIALAQLRSRHTEHCALLLDDGRVMVSGGGSSPELFDPLTGAWSDGPNPPNGGQSCAVLSPQREILLFSNDRSPRAWSPTTNDLRIIGESNPGVYAPLRLATRSEPPVILLHGRRTQGEGDHPNLQLWRLDATSTAEEIVELPARRDTSTRGEVAQLGDTLWVVGGVRDSGQAASTSCDLLVMTERGWGWEGCASLPEGRAGHQLMVSPEGALLVLGGASNIWDTSSATTWVLEPGAEVWVEGPPLQQARYKPTLVPLGPRRALVLGGAAGFLPGQPALSSAEVILW